MAETQRYRQDPEFQQGDQLDQSEPAGLYIECQDLFKIYKRADLEVVALRGLDLDVAVGR